MTPLNHYLNDGANRQARAVMCMLQRFAIEESWDKEYHTYTAEPQIARWENCREQGYVITMRANSKRICIAFFEHRNSDNISAIKWEQGGINSPTIDTAKFPEEVYKTKWDVSFEVGYGEIVKMAKWIEEQLTAFWLLNNRKTEAEAAN